MKHEKKVLTITFDTMSGAISADWDQGIEAELIKQMCEYAWCKAECELEPPDD
ncbi:hypothetical protein AAE250_16195 [Bacteroides sp. GD17]|jgi:uncharacterized protein YdhG (YjbR/CyaY superfamily)|uniref:hypothetical protein n=1 Tax=Bacteroides sp. GD17 TaxID=3139826 RepID=UPI00205CF519|nr:hypothetical protein [uncultured Bacteroides sp.]DAV67236.1 MAG TPA: hypothetical protein [Caudoviricetes sp.]